MLPFVVAHNSWATKCYNTKRIFTFFFSLVNFEQLCRISVLTLHARRTILTHGVETRNLKCVVSHRVSSNFEHDNISPKIKNKYFQFLSTLASQQTTSTSNCVVFAFFKLLFFILFFFFIPFRRCISVFILYKMEKTHFVVLFVSALASMPTIAADRFIETKYHCPKR